MSVATSTYYNLVRTREMSPDAQDWAVTDGNYEVLSLLLKAFEQHTHTGATALTYPGYNVGTPASPTLPTMSSYATGGAINAGNTVGVRLAYVNSFGLETESNPETSFALGAASSRPLTPTLTSTQGATPGFTGGTYIYGVTKTKNGGETLISDVLAVDIPYDTTYSVTLGFNTISSYTDGTTGVNIYRAAGLNSPFQLITSITAGGTTSFTDTGTVPLANAGIVPPSASTFDATNKVRITFGALAPHPAAATKLRIYVTQQTGIWGNKCLLQEVDLTSPPTYVDYLGTESLLSGSPSNASQIPASPPKINLTTQATGAPTLTANQDFAQYQALNLVLHSTASAPGTPVNGQIYYDSSIPTVRARINGAWVNWGTTAATAYTHPAEESGGHIAANIKFKAGSAVTAKTIFDRMNDVNGVQKNLTGIYRATVSGALTTASTSATGLTDCDITGITPLFDSQYAEARFSGHFLHDTLYATVTIAIEYDGSTITETIRSQSAGAVSTNMSFETSYLFQLGTTGSPKRVRVLWWVSSGTVTAVSGRRSLNVKLLA